MTVSTFGLIGWYFLVTTVIEFAWMYLTRKYDCNDYRLQAIWVPALARSCWVTFVLGVVILLATELQAAVGG